MENPRFPGFSLHKPETWPADSCRPTLSCVVTPMNILRQKQTLGFYALDVPVIVSLSLVESEIQQTMTVNPGTEPGI